MQESANLLTKQEAAARIRMKWRALDYLRAQGRIPFVKFGGKVLFLQSDLDRFVSKHRIVKTP
jgi:excisionase family DNA binding protein